jgi:hypothetical protein
VVGSVDASFERTREALHRVAAHVLARRRWEVTGRFGLRVSPGGIATPTFGDDAECVRIAGPLLVRESGGLVTSILICGSTLRTLAKFAGTNLDSPFNCGEEAPEVGDPDETLNVVEEHLQDILRWYDVGWRVLDRVLGDLPSASVPSQLQLWPEHFDIGTDVGLPDEQRVNLGCSPGDRYQSEPYLYVGPWGPERPGDPKYWNAPFGAIAASSDLAGGAGVIEAGQAFIIAGLRQLSREPRQSRSGSQ